MSDLKAAIAVFDKSADRTTPNAQTEAWKVIRAELMRLQDAPVVMLHTDSESADGEQIVEVMALTAEGDVAVHKMHRKRVRLVPDGDACIGGGEGK